MSVQEEKDILKEMTSETGVHVHEGIANEKEAYRDVASEETQDKEVDTQPKLNKDKHEEKRFHLTREQAEILAWVVICCGCFLLGCCALSFACQAKEAEDDNEYKRRLIWSTRCGIASLIVTITSWPLVALLIYFT
ncbi:uncharacterized protein LOC132718507 [Ruditapes philippinarum]|uniref:uncharacterized protein LOC132718507 n=1 Tax=Ruditapes philippinarum TaxID=129788 RepID=UPI00295B122B|nr:uncharacterized protein LOC132718507 [Ruditapes philippinarum]